MQRGAVAIFAVVAVLVVGCASSGNKMDRETVSRDIQKGVTTREQVEAKLGTPDSVSMLTDGRRMLHYFHFESQVKGTSFIPYAGVFMGGSNHKRQTLQILLDKQGIVQDYEFSEKATETSSNPFGTHTEEEVKPDNASGK